MIDELEWIWKEAVYSMYYLGTFMEGLRKTTRNISQESRSPGRDTNREPPEHE
jgi:hypothetical protein